MLVQGRRRPAPRHFGPKRSQSAPSLERRLATCTKGMIVLGVPLGCEEFVHAKGQKRLTEEQQLLSVLPHLPDLQCAWLLLYFSAVPRANHLLRAVPPTLVHRYALEHDKAVWETLLALLNQQPNDNLEANKRRAQLPCRLGSLGLRCSTRTAPAAYWAA